MGGKGASRKDIIFKIRYVLAKYAIRERGEALILFS
jgi:hypothetical protein